MLGDLRVWFKQLFCRHEYKKVVMKTTYNHFYVCKKCGKTKNKI